MKFPLFLVSVLALLLVGCASKTKSAENETPASAPAPAQVAAPIQAPALAAKTPATDEYFGETLVDDYRWLENWEDPKVQAWTRAMDDYTRASLAGMPQVDVIEKRVQAVLSLASVSYFDVDQSQGHFFALKNQPPRKQALLVQLKSLDDLADEKVILDPNLLDTSGATTIDFYRPSPDGTMVAISLSKGGSESGDVHVYDVATAAPVHEVIPRVNGGTAGGDLVWHPDSKGFFYTRYPRGEERPADDADFYMQVYFHALQTPTTADRYEIGKDFPRIAEIELTMHAATGRLLATVQNGDGGEFAHYLRSDKGAWKELTKFADGHVQVAFGPGTDLLVISNKGAPRGQVLRMPASGSVDKAKVVVPQSDDTIVSSFWGSRSLVHMGKRIFLSYQLGGPSELRVFDEAGKSLPAPEQLANSSAGSMVPLEDGSLLFENGSWTTPSAWYRFDPETGKTATTALVQKAAIDLEAIEVERMFATSKDGTRVPLNIMIPPGAKRDGSTPAIVNGYGGYGVNLSPRYRASHALMLEQGLIVVVVNLRGGGEYGEEWHRGGNLTNKQNVFDDYAAALQFLIDEKYSSSDKLIIEGGSNGGLLMGATLVQHPTLMKAVVSHVGIYDMLRVELSPNGAFNITEFGTVTNPEQYKALRAYSPYHHVVDGTKYPSVFLLTGANDPRVDPMQSRKFAARLRAATDGASQILLRTSYDTGHGGGTPLTERIAQSTDVMAFVLKELGRPFRAVEGGAL